MAMAAEGLNLPYLETWLLEQACQQDPKNPEPLRRLGAVHGAQKDLDRAIAAWEGVRKLLPYDTEAARKINALAIRETIMRGNYDG